MFEFFDSVLNFFDIVWQFIQNLINSIVVLFQILIQAIAVPPLLIGFVPGIVGVGILSMVGIAVAKLIVGRDN